MHIANIYISRREYIKVIHIDKFGSVKTIEKDTVRIDSTSSGKQQGTYFKNG
jgi:hypothetical protein